MTNNSSGAVGPIVEAYDFSGIKKLADVGGGHGLLLAGILRSNPALQGVLFDRPEVIESLPASQFAGCEGRIATEAGSFFERVPDGCDAYLMKHIIHDWDDERCGIILRLVREKLPKNGRVLVCEMVVSDDPGPTPAKLLDIEMLVMTGGGKERTHQEFADLFAASGLQLVRIVPTARPVRGDRSGAGLTHPRYFFTGTGAIAFHSSAGKPCASTLKICRVIEGLVPLHVQS